MNYVTINKRQYDANKLSFEEYLSIVNNGTKHDFENLTGRKVKNVEPLPETEKQPEKIKKSAKK